MNFGDTKCHHKHYFDVYLDCDTFVYVASDISVSNIKEIGQVLQRLRDTKCHHKHPFGIYLVIDKFLDVASETLHLRE